MNNDTQGGHNNCTWNHDITLLFYRLWTGNVAWRSCVWQ